MAITDQTKGLLITFLGVILVVPDSLFVRLITVDPLATAFWRSASSGTLVFFGLLIFGGWKNFRNVLVMGWLGWFYTLLIGSTAPAFVFAVSKTSVANVVFILASMPIFSAIFSRIFLKERIQLRILITALFVVIGLAFISFGSVNSEFSSWRGDVWALYVSIAYALALTAVRKLKAFSMIPAIPFGYIGAAIVISFFTDPLLGFSQNWILYLGHGLFIALGTCLLAIGPRLISASEVALLILLESVLAPLLVWILLGENPGEWALIGGMIVLCSLLISNVLAVINVKLNN
ncbi:MAG: DMT family transporter [Paracoccaceae bacterium]|nr:DMT family transporter [Paracoccaceae bacterium]